MNRNEVYRTICRSHFPTFARFAFLEMHGRNLVENWHLDVMLQALHDVAVGQRSRLIINAPPRTLKTFAASIALLAFLIGLRPSLHILLLTGDLDAGRQLTDRLRALMERPRYRALFPRAKLKSSPGLELLEGGSISFARYGSLLTGRAPDIVIIDEPTSATAMSSRRNREQSNNWFLRELVPRLGPSARVVIAMRRLHRGDLTAFALARGHWDHLCLSAVAEHDEEWQLSNGTVYRRWKRQLLCPALESAQVLYDRLFEIGATTFMAQYQQQPYDVDSPQDNVSEMRFAPVPRDWKPEMGYFGFTGWAWTDLTQRVYDRLFNDEPAPARPPSRRPLTTKEWEAAAIVQQRRLIEEIRKLP